MRNPYHIGSRLAAAALVMVLVLAAPGCRRKQPIHVQQPDEGAPAMASIIHAADPKSEPQLVSGFYGVEQNAWRWTARQFSVVLQPPPFSAKQGARLEFDLTVPQVSIDKLKTLSLSASVAGSTLPPETYTQAGSFTFKRDLPAGLLSGEPVRVDFELDKAMPPAGGDLRELGVVALRIALVPKQ